MSKGLGFIMLVTLKNFRKMARIGSQVFSRNICNSRILQESLSEPLKVTPPSAHSEDWKKWRTIFFVVCCPAMLMGGINAMLTEEKPRPKFVKYPYLRIRNKKFPWGDGNKTLFHNPHTNALPDGYEDEH